MDSKEVLLLKKALERQKKARQQAEHILEEKSKELYDVTHHLQETNSKLENLLSEKTSELDGVFINIIDPYVVMDLKFNVINMNTSAKEFLGYDHSRESLNLAKIVHPDFIAYTAQSFKSLIEVGTLKNYRAKIFTKDNSVKWILINSSLIYNTERKPIAAQGIVRDITHEMEIKQLLSEQKKQLDIIVENSPLGIVLTDEGKIVKTNATFAHLLGYTEAELKQLHVKDISAPEDTDDSQNLIRKMNNGEVDKFSIIKRYYKKAGGFLLAKTLVSSVKDEKGKVEYQVALIEDITKEREAEERLKTEREKYSSIIANMNLGLIEVDNHDIIQLVNHSFCKMSGFEEEELVGKKASDILKLKDKTIIDAKRDLRMSGESDSYEVEVLNKKGEVLHWLISGAPRYDHTKSVVGSIGIHLDITNQKLLEIQKEKLLKDLEKSNDGLKEYAHIVSHDLKSPLRSISALSSWLLEDYHDKLDENGKFNLQQIQEKIEGMDRLIDGILKYSSITDATLDNSLVDLNEVINEIREIIYVPDHVNIVMMNQLPKIKVDKTKIQQLFQNLLSNAVVNIERQEGLVEISSIENNSHWEFSIKDNGVGIPKEYHEKIFKIFQSIGHDERSTGIGLSIVKKIIDLYQGQIWLESEVGQGTTFHFTIKK
ncbi:PAS domain S-box protein [Maribacter algarum]|uniref:histidine kinase n=1 Tax=Maribacter algarum (ex Zhang et al. 2020) TaxID=2578118 RepID=A0A5S3PPN9_9FLAO|nr:PAS domain-containing sensor histidine kinase [Maribacter algarum]TMM56654.1 PAS domain S-box protein [Maribacter algarum]